MTHLAVRNWADFQHYRDRDPVWIKVYSRLLDDADFLALPEAAQAQLVKLWLVASRCKNQISDDTAFLRHALHVRHKLYIDELIAARFVERLASDVLADPAKAASDALAPCYQNASPHARPRARGEGEGEKEGEKETPTPPAREGLGFANQHGTDPRFMAFAQAVGPKRLNAWTAILDQWQEHQRLPLGLTPSTEQILDSLAAAVTANDGGPISERFVVRCIEDTVNREPHERRASSPNGSFLALHDRQNGAA